MSANRPKGKYFLFADRGETALRGLEEPVRLYEVRWGRRARALSLARGAKPDRRLVRYPTDRGPPNA